MRVLKDVLGLYGPDFGLTLEENFTQLEAMLATPRAPSKAKGPLSVADLRTA
jgi:hypothetical protein